MQLSSNQPAAPARHRTGVAAAAVTLALLLLGVGAAPADARSSFMSRTSGSSAETYWTQVDGVEPGTSPLGNVHIGSLYAYETTRGQAEVYGSISDWDCPVGELPWDGGPHDASSQAWEEEPPPSNCQWKGSRFIEAYGIAFMVDKKLTQARLTGTLTVYGGGHGEGGVIGRPYADIIWTGVGGVFTDKHTYRYRDAGTMEASTWLSSNRSATMGGILGPMGFDPDLSGGSISSFRTSSKFRTR